MLLRKLFMAMYPPCLAILGSRNFVVDINEVRKFYVKYKKVVGRNFEHLANLKVSKVLIGDYYFTFDARRYSFVHGHDKLIFSMTAKHRYLWDSWFEVTCNHDFDEALEGLINLLQARLDKLNEEEQRRKNTSTVTITIGGRRRRRGGEAEWF